MANQYKNKVIYNGTVLIDLTGDTAVANKVLSGYKFHLASGAPATGTCTFDVDSSGATASAAEVLATKTFAAGGSIITGTMPNRGAQTSSISTKAQEITIQQGYHDGSGKVSIVATEQAKIIAGNIKNGVTILGVEGTYTGSELIKATTGSATPDADSQVILPSSFGDYDYFTQFTVAAVPYTETDNAQGGVTVTIL